MTDTETIGTATATGEQPTEAVAVAPTTASAGQVVPTQEEAAPPPCPTCAGNGAMAPSYVYALGRIEPRFPTLSLEKEMAQATGRAETAGLTDRQALHGMLSERRNRYIVRNLCWVLTIEGLETYILRPHDSADWELLVEALRPTPRAGDVDAVVGVRGPLAPPQLCNGLLVPIILFSQIYSFDVDTLIRSIPRPEGMTAEQFTPVAEEVFNRIMQMTDNAGATDEHRALNYVAMRYPAIYATTADAHGRNGALTAIEVRPSRLSGVRRIVDVILAFTNRQTDVVEKSFVRVDVSEEFPFLVTKLSPYYDR
jgi:hypothetical protein